jgi:hypothetical protein
MSKCLASVCFWHKADNPTVPAFVCYWTKADKGGFWPGEVCPLLTQSGHCTFEKIEIEFMGLTRKFD